MRRLLAALCTCALAGVPALAAEWHVTTTGTSGGSGTLASPWDLQTAINHPASVHPGDTIWLHGGTYLAGTGGYSSYLQGTQANPIILRQAPGQRAVIDGRNVSGNVLTIGGQWTWYWGFEITNTVFNANADLAVFIGNSASMHGTGVRLVNLVIHDASNSGVGLWSYSVDSEMTGCVVYYCGSVENLDHGLYTQNRYGTKRITENIIFRNKAYGIHAYGSSAAYLEGFHFEGNILYDAGAIRADAGCNVIIGGGCRADRVVFQDNYTWMREAAGSGVRFGYSQSVANGTNSVLRNVIVGAGPMVKMTRWDPMIFRDNRMVSQGNTQLVYLESPGYTPTGWTVDFNRYHPVGVVWPFYGLSTNMSLATWRSTFGFDANSTSSSSRPGDNWVYLRANPYEPRRANLVVYNWLNLDSVAVDVSGVLLAGQDFELRDTQNWFGTPAVQGQYAGGTITVPMTGTAVAAPIVPSSRPIVHTPREFGAFVLLAVNRAPVVDAGADAGLSWPTNTTSLDATVSDDGLPNPPAVVTTVWSKVSGPGEVAFADPADVDTTATFSTTGTYVLRLTASDSELSASDDIQIIVAKDLRADFNNDDKVDGLDFLRWQANFNQWPGGGATKDTGDANGDGKVDGLDFLIWQAGFNR